MHGFENFKFSKLQIEICDTKISLDYTLLYTTTKGTLDALGRPSESESQIWDTYVKDSFGGTITLGGGLGRESTH